MTVAPQTKYEAVIGLEAKRDIKQGEPVTWDMLI